MPLKKSTKKATEPIKKVAPKTAENTKPPFESRPDLKKLVMYIIIVNYGQSSNILKMLKTNHSSAQFIQVGAGTATKKIRSILAIEDNRKEVVYSLIREDYVEEFKKDLDAYFAASKRNAGVAFTINLETIVGVKLYKFLTQTVRG